MHGFYKYLIRNLYIALSRLDCSITAAKNQTKNISFFNTSPSHLWIHKLTCVVFVRWHCSSFQGQNYARILFSNEDKRRSISILNQLWSIKYNTTSNTNQNVLLKKKGHAFCNKNIDQILRKEKSHHVCFQFVIGTSKWSWSWQKI